MPNYLPSKGATTIFSNRDNTQPRNNEIRMARQFLESMNAFNYLGDIRDELQVGVPANIQQWRTDLHPTPQHY